VVVTESFGHGWFVVLNRDLYLAFRHHVVNVLEIWQHNHLVVLPSRYEGLPVALVEAICCGRPALVTDVRQTPSGSGFVADAPTAKSLGAALERAGLAQADLQKIGDQSP
jgi:glycosyltransferase involved in cell wall biosynthesis